MVLTKEQGKQLLKLARKSIESAFKKTEVDVDINKLEFLTKKRGIFVTLKKNDSLRGCIGYPEPIFPLGVAILKAARSAAFEDPRFPPLEEYELKNLKIEVTVLTEPEEIKAKSVEEYPKSIKIGEDGLIIRKDMFSGLLLPQVATEHGFSAEEFLSQTCTKASLPSDAWKNKDTKIYKFQGQIFEE